MQTRTTALFRRPDTLFGVCEGIGQEFGFNANWLRIALAVAMIWNPEVVLAAYLVMGIAVYAARLIVPPRARRSVPTEANATARHGENDDSHMAAAAAA
ncbi:PspC domain-containing protein [Stakelama sp. CBK3Z-3]|uniref:PspC domain-containing protein n=1 Tax=Stakelama flava TaxID=2860338 RepID=A0ABS6XNW2_9SPHN|nr:PspC domain-containing protein [Stakelama flava]MBW4331096.1 PspC domain-containing protein [Stakelama flava]